MRSGGLQQFFQIGIAGFESDDGRAVGTERTARNSLTGGVSVVWTDLGAVALLIPFVGCQDTRKKFSRNLLLAVLAQKKKGVGLARQND